LVPRRNRRLMQIYLLQKILAVRSIFAEIYVIYRPKEE
jgi:hypothetical protein